MKAIVKVMWVNDADVDLDSYFPDDPECFGLWIEFKAGIEDESGADDFRLFVCTPRWIEEENSEKNVTWGRSLLIVSEYDFKSISAAIRQCVEGCTGANWPEIAMKISRFAAWEYEDYEG